MSQSMRVGVGRREITPEVGAPLMGYRDPEGARRAERVRDPLRATALVLEAGDARTAILCLELCLLGDAERERVGAAAEAAGLDPQTLLIHTTHTHSAPCTQGMRGWWRLDERYLERVLLPAAEGAMRDAQAALTPARLAIGTSESRAAINRRPINADHRAELGQSEHGPFDPTMTVLRFESADRPVASVVHYGAHPTIFGPDTRCISRDWPGVMMDRLEEKTGAPSLFLNGALGDIAPRTASGRAVGDGEAALAEAGAPALPRCPFRVARRARRAADGASRPYRDARAAARTAAGS
jgi:hypothetical protein